LALEATSMGRRRSARTTMPRPVRDHAALLNVDDYKVKIFLI
jgi:hypothetical protein